MLYYVLEICLDLIIQIKEWALLLVAALAPVLEGPGDA